MNKVSLSKRDHSSEVNAWLSEDTIHALERLLPDVKEVLTQRIRVLKTLRLIQPVGRRVLAEKVALSERIVRNIVFDLQKAGLIDVMRQGMMVTEAGEEVLEAVEPFISRSMGLRIWEERLKERLRLKHVLIVAGHPTDDTLSLSALGLQAAQYLNVLLKKYTRIAVAGGTTMAAMALYFRPRKKYPQVTFYPARGGLGEEADIQASAIAVRLAEAAGGHYVLFQIPDQLEKDMSEELRQDPYVAERLREIRRAEVVFHGIGDALTMARRRRAPDVLLDHLKEAEAVSEAFGAYFNARGELIFQAPTLGLSLDDLKEKWCVAVAGGRGKARAIVSLAKTGLFDVLITDQAAAQTILEHT
ncbi:MAG: sugar-binding domain-containing protein [Candidatus Carbobacillus sp.]|nr:sugar-binding domain-containing protein [Candidatus Carbobacillus sp.]